MRLSPEVRALCERAKRPALRVGLGLAMTVPALAMISTGNLATLDMIAGRAGQDVENERVQMALGQDAPADPVVQEWSERMVERERELVVASFAREFRIPRDLADNIHTAALENDIAPRMAFGLVQAESSFRTAARSPVGAVGLTQLMPATARWLVPGTTRRDLENPSTNLRIGFKYLRQLIDNFDGDEALALTAYNRGPGTVNRLLARGADPDNGYADKVLTGSSEKHVRLMNAKFGPAAKKRR
jgi:soluble lytic murein transglycosylase-like protein